MFNMELKNKIVYFISDQFPVDLTHAFTTRNTGKTPPPLDSFSLGTGQYRSYKDLVLENRQNLCLTLGMNFKHLILADQVHGCNVEVITEYTESNGTVYVPQTDALVTNLKGLPLLLLFADCTPLLFYDPIKKVLGIAHAGWKGTSQEIGPKTVQKMIEMFHCNARDIIAGIGPCIDHCCFEVSLDVAEQILKSVYEDQISDTIVTYKHNKAYLSLKQINAFQLENIGVQQIDMAEKCTACSTDMFFSHRKAQGKTGRHGLIAQIH